MVRGSEGVPSAGSVCTYCVLCRAGTPHPQQNPEGKSLSWTCLDLSLWGGAATWHPAEAV